MSDINPELLSNLKLSLAKGDIDLVLSYLSTLDKRGEELRFSYNRIAHLRTGIGLLSYPEYQTNLNKIAIKAIELIEDLETQTPKTTGSDFYDTEDTNVFILFNETSHEESLVGNYIKEYLKHKDSNITIKTTNSSDSTVTMWQKDLERSAEDLNTFIFIVSKTSLRYGWPGTEPFSDLISNLLIQPNSIVIALDDSYLDNTFLNTIITEIEDEIDSLYGIKGHQSENIHKLNAHRIHITKIIHRIRQKNVVQFDETNKEGVAENILKYIKIYIHNEVY
jgi:hypothetical protein